MITRYVGDRTFRQVGAPGVGATVSSRLRWSDHCRGPGASAEAFDPDPVDRLAGGDEQA